MAANLQTILLLSAFLCVCNVTPSQHTHFVIIGGTGDLARKYLWSSALQLFVSSVDDNNTITFYAGAREVENEGKKLLKDILDKIKCEIDDAKCESFRSHFVQNSKYVQLKTAEDYSYLCQSFCSNTVGFKIRQIFYFSVPSSAYQSVATNIHQNCIHCSVSSTKVVLEKPFGVDKDSAHLQAGIISKYFKDDDIHRVDHYLAKSVTMQILNFRDANRHCLEDLLNNQFVDRVEIVMKEMIGVKGRIEFYDQMGVVRDVMQNHLTELLVLVAMEIPSNLSDSNLIEQLKINLQRQVKPVNEKAILIGQYMKYIEEAKSELANASHSHLTATFAAALLNIDNSRWRGVPFVLISGKQMDERSSHIRILFREREFCVNGCTGRNSTFSKYPRQLVFQIGYGPVPSAGILVSRSLFAPIWPAGLRESRMMSNSSVIYGQSAGDFYYAVPMNDQPAYTTVFNALYNNMPDTFVTSTRMLLLWDIWDTVLARTKFVVPRLYKEHDVGILNFNVENYMLKYIHDLDHTPVVIPHDENYLSVISVPDTFRNQSLVCKSKMFLMQMLADFVLSVAKISVQERNVFHLALSGGKTPLSLFKELVYNYPLFPWERTHIWQVDERCVSQTHEESNFKSIYESLIKFINIPYFNIHQMPVNFAGRICDVENKGDKLYEDLIKHLIPAQMFDFILLGLGNDGHIASLFPGNNLFKNETRFVALTKSKPKGSYNRMSMLLPLLNIARQVTVLVTGTEKHNILQQISNMDAANQLFPITYIFPKSGNLTWYIDLEAWTGTSNAILSRRNS